MGTTTTTTTTTMMLWRSLVVVTICWSLGGVMVVVTASGSNDNASEAQEFLDSYNSEAQVVFYRNSEVAWTYQTNITTENQQQLTRDSLVLDLWRQNMSHQASVFNTTGFTPDMQRQFFKITDIGTAALEDVDKLEQLNNIMAQMGTIYSTARVCLTENDCLPLDPDITKEFDTSRDADRLQRLWVGWRDESGKKMKDLYAEFVTLSNEAVRTLGYADTGDYWRSWYETETFEQDVLDLFTELKPFYEELHAFVRRRLKAQYEDTVTFPASGHIPAHLLGNMWAQQWNTLQDLLMPYPDKPILDVTQAMVQQGYDADKIFRTADDFFTSLGLEPMPQEFWNKSMLEKPQDGREVVCHASAWDFYNGKDFRVKQCTEVTMDHFSTAHHEMGHIEYYLLYKNRPVVYRRGANPVVSSSPQVSSSPAYPTLPQPFPSPSPCLFPLLSPPELTHLVMGHIGYYLMYEHQPVVYSRPSVKQCTEVTMDHFSTAHHEMGHIEYFLLYKDQPVVYRGGANPGFHEAVGDVISLSVETPKHLNKIGLLPAIVEDEEADTNFLMAMALGKIAFLPFGYLIDQWRWSVFRGDTTPDNYNEEWWKLRCSLQGVSPPVARSEEDFDPGAKYHIPNNTPYIRYFVSFVLQFQFHQSLCDAANHTGPLHTCDIYNSSAAGQKMRELLTLGSSEVWTVPFEALTGQTRMSAQPLMDYFQPLMTFLQKANGEDKGWDAECPPLPRTSTAGRLSSSLSLLPSVCLSLAVVLSSFLSFCV